MTGAKRWPARAPRIWIASSLVWAWMASAAYGQAQSPPPVDDIPLDVVPLVDMNAPLVLVWFSESSDVPLEDASKAEGQVFEEIAKRMDLRMFSREKTIGLVSQTGDPQLQRCNWQTDCLAAIGRLAEADRVIGVKMSGTPEQYYLAFKRLDLHQARISKATSVVSGSLSTLLMSTVAETITSLLAAETQQIAAPEPEPDGDQAPRAAPIAVAPAEQQTLPMPAPETPIAPKASVVRPKPQDEQPQVAARPGFFRRHLGSTLVLSAGIVAAGIGIGFGVKASEIEGDMGFQYDPSRDDDGRANALTANVLLGLAGAAAVTALILFLVEPGADISDAAVAPSAGGALVRF